MRFSEYMKKTGETAVYPGRGETAGLMYATLGLVNEFGEFLDEITKHDLSDDVEKIMAEAGDVTWYAAEILNQLGYGYLDAGEALDSIREALWLDVHGDLAFIAGRIKKMHRGDRQVEVAPIAEAVLNVVQYVRGEVEEFWEESFDDVLQMNLDRLADRKARGVIKGDGGSR